MKSERIKTSRWMPQQQILSKPRTTGAVLLSVPCRGAVNTSSDNNDRRVSFARRSQERQGVRNARRADERHGSCTLWSADDRHTGVRRPAIERGQLYRQGRGHRARPSTRDRAEVDRKHTDDRHGRQVSSLPRDVHMAFGRTSFVRILNVCMHLPVDLRRVGGNPALRVSKGGYFSYISPRMLFLSLFCLIFFSFLSLSLSLQSEFYATCFLRA